MIQAIWQEWFVKDIIAWHDGMLILPARPPRS